MGEVVVALGEPDFGEGAVAAFPGEQERRDARGIGLEREREHVEHDGDVLAKFRDAVRRVDVGIGDGHAFGPFDALLDFAHAGQVLVEFLAVAAAEFAFDGVGVVQDEIQDGLLLFLPTVRFATRSAARTGAEKALEDQAWIGLGDNGCVGERHAKLYS